MCWVLTYKLPIFNSCELIARLVSSVTFLTLFPLPSIRLLWGKFQMLNDFIRTGYYLLSSQRAVLSSVFHHITFFFLIVFTVAQVKHLFQYLFEISKYLFWNSLEVSLKSLILSLCLTRVIEFRQRPLGCSQLSPSVWVPNLNRRTVNHSWLSGLVPSSLEAKQYLCLVLSVLV